MYGFALWDVQLIDNKLRPCELLVNILIVMIKYLNWDECLSLLLIANIVRMLYYYISFEMILFLRFIANIVCCYYVSRLRWVCFAMYCKPCIFIIYGYYISFEMSVFAIYCKHFMLLLSISFEISVFCNSLQILYI